MIKVQHGDHVIEAEDAADLVSKMHESSPFEQFRTDKEWMIQAAKRALEQCGKPVRVASAEAFVEDLILAGLLEEVP